MSQLDDLLQPSLTEDDDLKGFSKPWNPHSLVFAAFFAGPFTGGFLLSLNFRRLGMTGKFGKSLLLFIVLGLVMYSTITLLRFKGHLEWEIMEQRQICRICIHVITIAAAFQAAKKQRERFRLYEYSGNEAAGAWVPGILAVAAGAAITYAVTKLIFFLLAIITKTT